MADNEEELLNETTSEEVEGDEPQGEETETEASEEESGSETEAATPQPNEETKRWRDEATQSRGQLATALRAVKALRDEGILNDDQIAEAVTKQGLDAKLVKSVLDQQPAADDPLQSNAKILIAEFGETPGTVKLSLDDAMGEDTKKFFEAYNWLIGVDPAERQALADVDPRKVVAYAVRRGKEVLAEYEELKTHGGSLLAAFRASKAKPVPAKKKERVPLNGGPGAPERAAEAGAFTKRVLG